MTSSLSWPARWVGLPIAIVALLLAALASLAYGSVDLEWANVVSAFTRFDGSNADLIVRELRLPRTLIGIGAGAGLAVAGVLMQGVTRNPLAEPGILGINAGAALFVVGAIFLLGITGVDGYVWFAFAGAGLAAVAVYVLGSAGGRDTPMRLALAGAVIAALLGSLTAAMLVIDAQSLDLYRFWAVGSLAGRDLGVFMGVAPFLAAGLVLALACGPALNTLSLGDDAARGLGQRVDLVRGVVAVAVILLAGAAVAAAGPIAFVGLAVPHGLRALLGSDHRWLLVYAALAGPILLLVADIVGRMAARPAELQVGIVTALIGAPLFVLLVRRPRLVEL